MSDIDEAIRIANTPAPFLRVCAQREDALRQLAAAQAERDDLRATLDQTVRDALVYQRQQEGAIERLQGELARLKADASGYWQERIAALEAENERLREGEEQRAVQCRQLFQRIDNAQERVAALEAENAALRQELEKCRAR